MEDGGNPGADAECGKHVAELRERGEGEHALDIGLRERNGRGEDCGEDADRSDDEHRLVACGKEWAHACHQVDTGVHHRCGVDECGDRSRSLHCVGEPDVERELCRLSDRAAEDQQCDHGGGGPRQLACGDPCEDRRDVERAEDGDEPHQAEREPDVAHAVGDERLLRGESRIALGVPEADEQVRGEADELPRREDDEQVARQHQKEHGEHEEIEIGEEAPVARVVAHVADAVQVHERADGGDHEKECAGQRVDVDSQAEGQVS